jgi:hypothetical protein
MIKVEYYADKNETYDERFFSDIAELNTYLQLNPYIKDLLKEGYDHQFHEYIYVFDNGDDALFFRSLMITTEAHNDEMVNNYIRVLRHKKAV